MANKLQTIWERRAGLAMLLLPLTVLYCLLVGLRRWLYRSGLWSSTRLPVPVIVIGNLTTGGTGKTPLVITAVEILKNAGYKPGIISRGYGGGASSWPQQVRPDADPLMVGDEPVIISRHTQCPMAVGPDRVTTGRALLKHHDCDIIVSDDGLQHYALERDIEILVIDGRRRYGNGWCLPAGPLREPLSRLREVDLLVSNGEAQGEEYQMNYEGSQWRKLSEPGKILDMTDLAGKQAHAIAAVGNPQRFFDMLRGQGIRVIEHAFPDHHYFKLEELQFADNLPLLMTEKDAVKCERLPLPNAWYLPVTARVNRNFNYHLLNILDAKYGQKTA